MSRARMRTSRRPTCASSRPGRSPTEAATASTRSERLWRAPPTTSMPAAGFSSSTATTRRSRWRASSGPPASGKPFPFPTSPGSRAWPGVKLGNSLERTPGRSTHRRKRMSVQDKIREQVTSHPVVLYMKGSPQLPQCGFSATATQLLKMSGAEGFYSVDVLQNPDIREGIKQFANWPTIPQLYVNGEFVGGSDIMKEMYQSGELQKLIAAAAKP